MRRLPFWRVLESDVAASASDVATANGGFGPWLCENALCALDLPADSEIDRSDWPTTHDLDASNG